MQDRRRKMEERLGMVQMAINSIGPILRRSNTNNRRRLALRPRIRRWRHHQGALSNLPESWWAKRNNRHEACFDPLSSSIRYRAQPIRRDTADMGTERT